MWSNPFQITLEEKDLLCSVILEVRKAVRVHAASPYSQNFYAENAVFFTEFYLRYPFLKSGTVWFLWSECTYAITEAEVFSWHIETPEAALPRVVSIIFKRVCLVKLLFDSILWRRFDSCWLKVIQLTNRFNETVSWYHCSEWQGNWGRFVCIGSETELAKGKRMWILTWQSFL